MEWSTHAPIHHASLAPTARASRERVKERERERARESERQRKLDRERERERVRETKRESERERERERERHTCGKTSAHLPAAATLFGHWACMSYLLPTN